MGKFGMSVIDKIIKETDFELELVDKDSTPLENYKHENISLNLLNSEQKNALEDLGINTEDTVLISMGSNLRSSILTCQNLLDIGIEKIYVRVVDERHERIMKSIGIDEKYIIRPYKIASDNCVYKMTYDFDVFVIDKESDYLILRIINNKVNNKTLKDLKLNKKDIHVLLLTPNGEINSIIPEGETKINLGDTLSIVTKNKNKRQISKIFYS
ncbi:MAG: NAD-binding protein [Mollicutes bacterium]|nr:MAG: NAD-binding protein [Mollicutes bacterium]